MLLSGKICYSSEVIVCLSSPPLPSPPLPRSDVALMVRQAALHVWKVVVTNTARSLREILPTLIQLLLSCLASESHDKRKVAARTLGDLVRKLGERVLPEVIPMLKDGLGSHDSKERQGVCIGLSEIIQQTSRDNVLLYIDSLLPTIRSALCDKEQDVRAAAAQTFDSLHSTVGESVVPFPRATLSFPWLRLGLGSRLLGSWSVWAVVLF